MSDKEYEHRVVRRFPTGPDAVRSARTPQEAGQDYRDLRKYLLPGESIHVQRREVGPWKDVPDMGGAS